MALTPKQVQFVQEYLVDLNATKAAIRAGYSERTANQQGPRLLENSEIATAIDAAKVERSRRTRIDAIWVLKRLVAEATADIADLYDRETGELKKIHDWPEVWRQGLVQAIDTYEERDAEGNVVGHTRKLKIDSRVRRTELIGKHVLVNAFQDLLKHDVYEGLADRLARAKSRERIEAAPLQPASLPVNAGPSTAPTPSKEAPAPPPEPPTAPGSDTIIAAKPLAAPYRSMLWPEEVGKAEVEYDPTYGSYE